MGETGRPDLPPDGSAAAPSVGPVLARGPRSQGIVAAIYALNREVQVIDRGAYLRVLVAGPCRLTRSAVEQQLGEVFRLPADLEEVMVSYRGTLRLTQEEAIWT